jgi:hypothetical protein
MGEIAMFPGTSEVSGATEPEFNIEDEFVRQADLLVRWVEIGNEIRRRLCNIPSDIGFALAELLRESRE